MSDYARITVRVSNKTKKQMDASRDKNWSEIIRNELKKHLNRDIGEIRLRNKIRDLKAEGNLSVLKALYMFSQYVNQVDLSKNLEIMHGIDREDTSSELKSTLEHLGIENPYSQIGDGIPFNDALMEIYLEEGIIDLLQEQVEEYFRDSETKNELAKGLRVLSYYIDGHEDDAKIRMITRLVSIIFSHFYNEPLPIMEELNHIGIFFSTTYSSKAYYHHDFHIPIYAYRLLHYIRQSPYMYSLSGPYHLDTNLLEEILSENTNREVFRLLKGFNNSYKESDFEELVKDFDHRNGEGSFKNAMAQLLEKGVVLFEYWPHRSRAGKRSSSPDRITCVIPPKVREMLIQTVLQKTGKDSGDMSELELLVNIYEKQMV